MIGHDLSREEIRGRVRARWHDRAGLPVPAWEVRCPVCGSAEVCVRRYNFHRVKESPEPERVDVLMKCLDCSHSLTFGIPWPHPDGMTFRVLHWRDARTMMEAES